MKPETKFSIFMASIMLGAVLGCFWIRAIDKRDERFCKPYCLKIAPQNPNSVWISATKNGFLCYCTFLTIQK